MLSFYTRLKPKLPTLDSIHQEEVSIPGIKKMSKASIYCFMNKLGFVCKERKKKMQVYQGLDVVDQRHKNLHRIC